MLQIAQTQLLKVLLDIEIIVFLLLVDSKARDVDILAREGIAEHVGGTQIDD